MNAKRWTALMLLALAVLAAGCGQKRTKMPEDFSFALVWNVCGDSRYDSDSGVLVKQASATCAEDYTTQLELTDRQLRKVWSILEKLDLDSYPDECTPGPVMTKPPTQMTITVRTGGAERTVSCRDATGYLHSGEEGKAYVEAMEEIIRLICATEEWKALPEYEFLYE